MRIGPHNILGVSALAGIRVSDESEALGLDRAEHSEGGYSLET